MSERQAAERGEFAMVFVALGACPRHGFLAADEIRGLLKGLFGIDLTGQRVAAALKRMTEEECPRFERRKLWDSREWFYRATRYAQTDLENKLPNLRLRERAS